MPFFGRNAELNELDRLYEREGATFGVVYGRRRVGKTALLTHWLKTRKESEVGMRAFLWFASRPTTAMPSILAPASRIAPHAASTISTPERMAHVKSRHREPLSDV